MKHLTAALAKTVILRPKTIIIVTLLITAMLAVFASQQEIDQDVTGFAPATPEFAALETIGSEFSAASEETIQVVFNTHQGDVLTVAGLKSYIEAKEIFEQNPGTAPLLADRPGGDIVGFFNPFIIGLEQKSEEMGIPISVMLDNMTDEQVKQGYTQALEAMPVEYAAQITSTLASDVDLAQPSASAGLMLVFLNTSTLDEPETQLPILETNVAEELYAISNGDVTVAPFSMMLLFGFTDDFSSEVGRLFLFAFLVILAILIFVYWTKPKGGYKAGKSLRRSLADTGMTLAVIISAILWMNGIGVLLGPKYLGLIGPSSSMLQILPVLLIGLGVDYAIHLTARYREEIGAKETVNNASTRAISSVGIALTLATVTTAVGFLTNIVNPIGALRDFGILAAIGIVTAFILMMTFFPAVRVLLDRGAEKKNTLPVAAFGTQQERLLPKLIGSSAVLAEKLPVVTILIAVMFGVLGGYGLLKLDTTFNFTDFLPEDNVHVKTLDTLSNKFGGGFEQTAVLVTGNVATPQAHNALLASLGASSAVKNTISFDGHLVAESPISVIARLAMPPEAGGDAQFFDPGFAKIAAENGLQPDMTIATNGDVTIIYDAALKSAPEAMSRVVAKQGNSYMWTLSSITTTAGEPEALALGTDLSKAFEPSIQTGAEVVATSQNIVSQNVITSLQSSQIWSLILTLGAAMLLLIIAFGIETRRPFLGVITIAPVALVVLWVFGTMAARGISFNVVTAMIANLAIGIGVPYTIHITHRYLEDRQTYSSPQKAVRSTATHTGGALAGSAFTTAAGFGVLMTSSLKPFQQFGEVTFWAILFALIASVLVLPSMLVLWDKYHTRNGGALVNKKAYHKAFDED